MKARARAGIAIAFGGLVLIALGLFVATRVLNLGLSTRAAPSTPPPEAATKAKVAVAANDVTAGKVLTSTDVKLAEVPIDLLPRDTIANLDDAVGRISKTDLYQGEMVLQHDLANPTGQTYDIAWVLDEHHVLMALSAEDLMSRQSIVKRGDIVDILATYNTALTQGQDPQDVTFDAYQRLDITAIVVNIVRNSNETANQQAAPTPPDRSQVQVQAYLVALDPQDALVIKYLKDTGANFDLVLRAPTSSGQFQLTPVTAQYIRELYGLGLLP